MQNGFDVERLAGRLRSRARTVIDDPAARRAAVLVPVLCTTQPPRIVLFERTHQVLDHKGEICFPGGAVEPYDDGPIGAALRESNEELGITPADVAIIGQLDDVRTFGSNYIITPVVGRIIVEPSIVANPLEVARPLFVSLGDLCRPGAEVVEERLVRGQRRLVSAYPVDGGRIWGATGRIVRNLLDVWHGAAAPGSA